MLTFLTYLHPVQPPPKHYRGAYESSSFTCVFRLRQCYVEFKHRNIIVFLLKLHMQHFRIDLNIFANYCQNIAFQIRQVRRFAVSATALCDDNL